MSPRTWIYTIAGATSAVVIAPIAAPVLLGGMFGITAAGPIAGGVFAGLQAGGAVTAGSSLAVVQSIAMGGALPFVGSVGAAAIGGAAGALAAQSDQEEDEDEREVILARLRAERDVDKTALECENVKVVCVRCGTVVWDEAKKEKEGEEEKEVRHLKAGIEAAWDAWVEHRHK